MVARRHRHTAARDARQPPRGGSTDWTSGPRDLAARNGRHAAIEQTGTRRRRQDTSHQHPAVLGDQPRRGAAAELGRRLFRDTRLAGLRLQAHPPIGPLLAQHRQRNRGRRVQGDRRRGCLRPSQYRCRPGDLLVEIRIAASRSERRLFEWFPAGSGPDRRLGDRGSPRCRSGPCPGALCPDHPGRSPYGSGSLHRSGRRLAARGAGRRRGSVDELGKQRIRRRDRV